MTRIIDNGPLTTRLLMRPGLAQEARRQQVHASAVLAVATLAVFQSHQIDGERNINHWTPQDTHATGYPA